MEPWLGSSSRLFTQTQTHCFLGCFTDSDCASLSCSIGKEVLSVPSSWSYERANFQRLGNVLIIQAKVPPAKEPVGFCCLCQKRKNCPVAPVDLKKAHYKWAVSNASRHVIHLGVMAGNVKSAVVFVMVHFCCLTCLPFHVRVIAMSQIPSC